MRLSRSMWRAVLAVLLVVLPLTALVIVPAAGAADPVLYPQTSNPSILSYAISTDYAAPFDTSDSMTADDFTVPVDAKWQITQVDVGGSPLLASQPTSFNVFIYSNNAGVPGTQIFSATNLTYVQALLNYSIALPAGPTLTEGTYWLVVQANAAIGQNWGWMNRTVTSGTQAKFVNPGGFVSPGCTTGWTNRSTCLTQPGSPDQIFALFGLTLPNLPPVNTVPGAQGPVNDDATLVFSTANGNAISTADPDAGGENVQVSVSVLHGTLTIAPGSGVNLGCGPCGGDGTGTVVFRGKLTEVNAALNGLVYNPADGYGGPDTLTILTDDRGNNGTGGAQTDSDQVAITVKARTTLTLGVNTIEYGGANSNLNACLDTVVDNALTNLSGQTIVFKFDGNVIATATTTGAGPSPSCVNVTGPLANLGLNAGTYFDRLTAEFAGSTYLLPSSDTTSTLTIQKRILYIKPIDREVVLKQPNPPTVPSADPNCPAPSRCLELTNGSTFAGTDTFASLNLTNLRFQYSRIYPSGVARETVGMTYRITAVGALSTNYEVRYVPASLKVIAPTP